MSQGGNAHSAGLSKPFEESHRGAGRLFGEFFEGDAAQGGEVAGGVGDVGGFAAFAAMRDGREVGRVGFEHEVSGGHVARGFGDDAGVFEGGDAGEGNKVTSVEQGPRLIERAGVAVKNAAQTAAIGHDDGAEVIPAFAIVQDDVQAELHGEIELRAEAGVLMRAPVFQRPAVWRRVEVIEADFANGGDFRMLREGAEFVDPGVAADGIDIAGMDAGGEAHIRLVFRDGDEFAGVFEIDGGRDHARDASGAGALEHSRQIDIKLAAAEVGVGVGEHVSG